jgi:hypothetical protein
VIGGQEHLQNPSFGNTSFAPKKILRKPPMPRQLQKNSLRALEPDAVPHFAIASVSKNATT